MTGRHALQPPRVNHALGNIGAGAIEAKEWATGDILEELGTISKKARPETVEYFFGQTTWVCIGFDHQGRNGGDKHGFGDAPGAMSADLTGNFASSR